MSATAAREAPKTKRLSIPQMLRLMQLEMEKAQRFEYPISCILVGLDGLDEERDTPRRKAIMPVVFHELKKVTFERKVQGLGFWTDTIQLAVFPHCTPDQVEDLGAALVERAGGLQLEDALAETTVRLSVGVAHNQHSGPMSFEILIREAETGLSMARQSGGNRCVQWLEVESELDRLREALEEQMEEVAKRGEQFAQEQDELAERRSKGFVARIHEVFAQEEVSETSMRLEKEMIALAIDQVNEWRQSSLAQELSERTKQVDNLERRVRKLTELLDVTEEELRRVAAMKQVDTGISSIYRTVQGLSNDEANAALKRELMKSIFEANLALLGRDASES